MTHSKTSNPIPRRGGGGIPKLCGGDIELANFIFGAPTTGNGIGSGTGAEAARALLRQIEGVAAGSFYTRPATSSGHSGWSFGTGYAPSYGYGNSYRAGYGYGYDSGYGTGWPRASEENPQDIDRRFLTTNGGCAYIDLSHLEVCLPEVRSAYDHVACWHALLRMVRDAQVRANQELPEGQTVKVLANNSDGKGHSYGSHLNFLLTRTCWDNLFKRRLHHALHIATYLASSILFAGAGKVGAESGESVPFQISQRADFFESLTATQTTYDRPLLNSRDESLADSDMARFHLILFDSTLQHGASLLKVGVTQIVLAMLEQGQTDPLLFLDDPVEALHTWSRDPDLEATATTADGRRCTALDVQWMFFERATRFVASGCAEPVVPRVHEIMALWEDTLTRLGDGRVETLTGRLDWVLKRSLLRRAMDAHGLAPDAPALQVLDQTYHSLDPDEGLYWACERAGGLERYVPEERICHFTKEPPEDTRAWTRAHLLRRGDVEAVDWDRLRFADDRIVWMRDPLRFTRQETGALFEQDLPPGQLLDQLESTLSPPTPHTPTSERI